MPDIVFKAKAVFIIGLIMFSLGTNLPKLVIVKHSFKNKVSELSLSNIIGSAILNVVIIGMLALFRPFKVQVDAPYYALVFFMILTAIYLLFLIVQLGFLLVS